MITDQPMDADRPWGAPAPPEPDRPRWSGRKTAVALAVAVIIAGAGGVAIYAATSNDSSATPGGPGGGGPGGGFGGGPGFAPGNGAQRGGGLGALATALHGEFVLSDGSTELLQTGKVTSVSATSIALTSTDGYAKTYTIDSSTVIDNGRSQASDVKTGDQVTVIAKSEGAAVAIEDRTNEGQGGMGLPQQPPAAR
jgi:hypothetical protein